MPAKRALLVGIDRYAHIRPLDGCVNDARLMRSVLVDAFDFAESHITMLLNEQATRDAMLAAFDALIESTGADDIVVIHYAGHGSRMTDREGDELSGFDSTLMPFDTARAPRENRDITDDEIHVKLEALAEKTPFTTLIIDACHSGTIARDAFGAKVRAVEADRRPISELPPSPIPHGRLQRTRSGASGWMPLAHKYVLIAGCRDEEESKEYFPPEGGGPHGALTYFLCQQLSRVAPGTTYRDLFERAAPRVTAEYAAQHPQMEGEADREIFGVTDLAPAPFVPVVDRKASTVVLGGGAARGLTVGSTYGIFPQGTKDPTSTTALGDIEITFVRAFAADATITRENAADLIVPGARAFESRHVISDLSLAVQLAAAGPEAALLNEMLQRSGQLTVVSDDAPAVARIYLLPPRADVSPAAPVPQAGALSSPKWAVVDATGVLVMPLKNPGEEAAVVKNLEKMAKRRRVLAIENTNPRSRLRDRFSLEIVRQGEEAPAASDKNGGRAVFVEGQKISLRIGSRHDAEVHITLVVAELDGAVNVVPLDQHASRLKPNETREIRGDLNFPEGYPFDDASRAQQSAGGVEIFKLFVSTQPIDLSGLAQTGVRSSASSTLMNVLSPAFGGPAQRSFTPEPAADDDWTTVTRSFVLRRASDSVGSNPASGTR